MNSVDVAAISAQVLAFLTKLAPLSVIIAALALLHNFRQARAKRDRDDAVAVREVLHKLGVKAYLLNWSLVGQTSIAAAVLQMRESIEARVGREPAPEALASFTSDQLLFEAVVEKGWRDSAITEKFQADALEFGKLRADLGNRVPLIEAALEVVDTRLRLLFLRNVFVVFSIRNDQAYKALAKAHQAGQVADPMARMHRLLFRASNVSERDAFSEACKLLEDFSHVAATAEDTPLLHLVQRRRRSVSRLRDWLAEERSRRGETTIQQALLDQLKDKAPTEYPLLKRAADEVMRRRRTSRVATKTMERSAARILEAFKSHPGADNLRQAASKFIAKQVEKETRDLKSLSTMLLLRSQGVDDPDIDIFLASSTGVTELAKSAIDRGASGNVSLDDVVTKHHARLRELGMGEPTVSGGTEPGG